MILGPEDRHGYIQQSALKQPGPGQYNEADNAAMSASKRGSRAGAFSLSARTTEFDSVAIKSARVPGPAEYTLVES